MQKLLLAVLCVIALQGIRAQQKCYSTQVVDQLRVADPVYHQGLLDAELSLKKWVASGEQDPYYSARAVRTIPLAVHVLYNTTAQNVSDAAIQNVVNKLNQAYRKLNTSLNSARSAVQPLAADVEIEFCLAQRTPSGQATNGIEHVQTSTSCFNYTSSPNAMKSTSTGGANPWNSSKYLNVWIVDLCGSSPTTGGTAGYAYLPTTGMHGSSIDGLVIEYSIGMNVETWVHEIGHYLGLHHIWGDLSGNACGNVFPDTDDGFSDTPDSKDPNYGCSYKMSCTNNSSYGDQYENYMDYSSCTVLFTTQQANYMNNVLTNTRGSLVTNNLACTPLSGPVASFTATPTSICTGQTVQFTSTSTGTNLTYSWSFPGGTPSTSTVQNPAVVYNTAGTYSVTLTVTSGGQNNTATQNNYIVVSGANALPLQQGFESTTFPPTGWTITNADNSTTWVRTTSASGYGTSSASAYVNNYNYSSTNQKDWLITPSYNFASVSAGRIKWDYAYAPYTQSGYSDSLEVFYSTNCGTTWTSIWKKGGSSLATATATSSNFVPTSSQWKTDSVSLASLNGQANVRFAFVNTNRYGNNIFLDNVNIFNATPPQGQAPVADFVGVPTTVTVGNSVAFTDLSTNTPTSWSWSFTGGTPSTSTIQNPSIVYNAVGTYPVTLTATNANGSNSVTKTAYITVVQGGGTQTCDTLTNFVAQDTLTYYVFTNNGGYVTGHNAQADKAKAEYYVNPTPGAQVTGALFYFVVAKTLNPNTAFITAKVWDATGTGNSPGNTLASKQVLISSIAQNVAAQQLTFVSFNTPATVSGNFFVGFEMTNAAGDTVALVSSTMNSPAPNYGWEQKSNNSWATFQQSYGINGLDLFALPIICTGSQGQGPTASFTSNNTTTCSGGTISFTSTSTGNPTSYSWSFPGGTPSSSTSANPTVTYNTAGTYNVSLTVYNANGSNNSTQNNYITVYAKPTLTMDATPVSCFGGSNGSASASATGGLAPYTYSWSGGGTGSVINNKPSGSYTVTVTDNRQCTASASINIGQPLAALTLTPNAVDALCGLPNGSASVAATGGAGGYIYSWSTGGTNQSIVNLSAGNYSVTVTDANNCTSSVSIAITNQTVSVDVNVNTTAACGSNNGSASAVVTNSTQSVSGYNWNTGGTSGSIANLAPGTYSVTVTLANGCTGTATGQVVSATAPTASAAPINGTCQTAPQINLTVNGGTAPFSYSWSNGASTEDVQGIPAGSYSVTITDANGCSVSAAASVADNSTVSVTFSTQNPVQGNDGSITANAGGGAAPYTYQWSNGGTTQTISNLNAGTYTVTVTDNAGCIKVASVTILSTGITAVQDILSVTVFPNPAYDVLNVAIELSRGQDVDVEILNAIGQQVYETRLPNYNSGTERFDIGTLAAGVYVVRVNVAGSTHAVRLVKL
ncbi:MAG: PKD domain-containing protein [Chitinophagales bacterium]|nr:PKD domain-containing protein [Chitinophagales bacterium]